MVGDTFTHSHKLKEKHDNDLSTVRVKVTWHSEALIARLCLHSNRLYFLGMSLLLVQKVWVHSLLRRKKELLFP